MPSISVIMPVYNSQKYLEACLESLFHQSFQDFELIAVNDGSTDGSGEIIRRYQLKYPGRVLEIRKENGGQGAARNVGIERASGEYVLFFDSDDTFDPQMLELLFSAAEEHGSDLVVCDYNEVDESTGRTVWKKTMGYGQEEIHTRYLLSNPSPWNKLIRLRLLRENHIRFLEHHIYEDLATLPLLACYAEKITYVEKPLYTYILHAGSTMRQKAYNQKLESIFPALAHLTEEFRTRGFYEKYESRIEYLYIEHLLYGANGRFLLYPEGYSKVKEIKNIIRRQYPNWRKNPYYKMQSPVFKITCGLFYCGNRFLLRLYNRLRGC